MLFIGVCTPCKSVLDRFIIIEEVKAAQRQKLDTAINPKTDYKQMELLGKNKNKKTFHRIITNGMSQFKISAGYI